MSNLKSVKTALILALAMATPCMTVSLTAAASGGSTSGEVGSVYAVPTQIAPPTGFEEGTETRLSEAQIAEILPWARSSKSRLEDLLKRAARVSPRQGVQVLDSGIRDVVLASMPKQTELLMRYTLNRGLKINEMLVNAARGINPPGLVHQQMRVLTSAIKFALKYYQNDLDFLNAGANKQLPYAVFGLDHALYMMELAQGIMSAKAQYQVMISAQGLLAWDLSRDKDMLKYADQIGRIAELQRTMPDVPTFSDTECVERMRMILGVYGDLGDLSKLLADARAAAAPIPSTPVAQPVSSVAPVINMAFVTIPAGTFQMGSLGSEVGRYSNEALHTVTISRSFEMQTTTITQRQWFDVMGNNPSDFKDQKYCKNDYVVISGVSLCPNNPVEQIFWNDAQGFIQKLNARGDGYVYRLPTEAEWEYAARAGTQTAYFFGNDVSQLGNYAWFDGNSGSQTHAVATKPANGFGLYDMHGNVWQWVQDWYGGDYSSGSVIDPSGPSSGAGRVLRGGGWFNGAQNLRAARRSNVPCIRYYYVGARLVRTAAEQR